MLPKLSRTYLHLFRLQEEFVPSPVIARKHQRHPGPSRRLSMLHAAVRLRLSPKAYHQRWLRQRYQPRRSLLTLAIETSCDDTAVAVLEKKSDLDTTICESAHDSFTSSPIVSQAGPFAGGAKLLFNQKVTSRNTGLGGIHPLEALESHQTNLAKLVSDAVKHLPDAPSSDPSGKTVGTLHQFDGKTKQLPDFISVTRGPGMRSNLNCGLDTAKGLAAAWQIPLLGVHHMQAHALTPRLVHALDGRNQTGEVQPKFPFLTLLVSGGHTMLLHSRSLNDHEYLATTRDIAIGDALDKCGRIILPESIKSVAKDTAFARYLSDYAFPNSENYRAWRVPARRADEIDKPDNEFGWQVQTPLAKSKDTAFSFTGIASSVENLVRSRSEQLGGLLAEGERLRFAQTALGVAFEHLASRTIIALELLSSSGEQTTTLVVSGGVAANAFLRHFLREMLDIRGFGHVQLLFPPPWLCTDNAAMIAWCGMEMFEAGFRSDFDVGSMRKWSMDSATDGGILGASGWMKADSSIRNRG